MQFVVQIVHYLAQSDKLLETNGFAARNRAQTGCFKSMIMHEPNDDRDQCSASFGLRLLLLLYAMCMRVAPGIELTGAEREKLQSIAASPRQPLRFGHGATLC